MAFMWCHCNVHILKAYLLPIQIREYLEGVGTDVPLILEGGAGSGKSSLVAKVADVATTAALQGKIPGCVSLLKWQWKSWVVMMPYLPSSVAMQVVITIKLASWYYTVFSGWIGFIFQKKILVRLRCLGKKYCWKRIKTIRMRDETLEIDKKLVWKIAAWWFVYFEI